MTLINLAKENERKVNWMMRRRNRRFCTPRKARKVRR